LARIVDSRPLREAPNNIARWQAVEGNMLRFAENDPEFLSEFFRKVPEAAASMAQWSLAAARRPLPESQPKQQGGLLPAAGSAGRSTSPFSAAVSPTPSPFPPDPMGGSASDPYAAFWPQLVSPVDRPVTLTEALRQNPGAPWIEKPGYMFDPGEATDGDELAIRWAVMAVLFPTLGLFPLEIFDPRHKRFATAENAGQGGGKGALGVRTTKTDEHLTETVSILWYANDGRVEVANAYKPGARELCRRIAAMLPAKTSAYKDRTGGRYYKGNIPKSLKGPGGVVATMSSSKPTRFAAPRLAAAGDKRPGAPQQGRPAKAVKFCEDCGAPGGRTFCPGCGAKLED
jgi:hypothetical protein